MARARYQRKPGQAVVVLPVLSLAPCKANIGVRTGPAGNGLLVLLAMHIPRPVQ
jgi:hypothetical protein